MAKASDNPFPSLLVVPGDAPATPASGERLFLDSGDGNKLKRKDASGGVTTIEGGGGASASGSGDIDDPSTWTADLGYDEEFNTPGSSLPTGWAWTNQGTASYVCKYGAGILTDPSSASDQARIIDRALPAGAWEATFKLSVRATPAAYHAAFVALRESSSGKLVLFGPQTSSAPVWRRELYYWTNPTTPSAPQIEVSDALAPVYKFWRVRRNSATSWDFEYSLDGLTWASMSAARDISTHCTPDRIGFAVYRNGQDAGASLSWFRVR